MILAAAAWCNPGSRQRRSQLPGTVMKCFSPSIAVVAAWMAISPAWAQTEVKAARPSVNLELGAGSSYAIDRPFKTVLIGDPQIVDVRTQDERTVLLKPLGPGATNLVFIDEKGVVIVNLAIRVRDADPI
jgi:Flp pilus assembly secretin CpaC